MAFFRRVKKRLQGDDPQQLKRELQWLQTQVGRYKGKILAVGLLSLTGTIMGLISSVASKYLIDAVTGYGADMLWRAVAVMAVMLLESLVLQGVSSRVGGSGNRYPIAAGTRGVFAYVPQGNSVFPDATDGELEQALKIACAWDFVSQFPDGVNHRLGTGGRGISEGQAQRLAIARALLRKAPILLLDEATSDLDMATERRLLDNLRQSGLLRTCILVTHRPDQVLALVTAVRRKEKLLQPGSFWWDFFEKVRIRVIPLRPGIAAAYSALTGAFCKAETAHD